MYLKYSALMLCAMIGNMNACGSAFFAEAANIQACRASLKTNASEAVVPKAPVKEVMPRFVYTNHQSSSAANTVLYYTMLKKSGN